MYNSSFLFQVRISEWKFPEMVTADAEDATVDLKKGSHPAIGGGRQMLLRAYHISQPKAQFKTLRLEKWTN